MDVIEKPLELDALLGGADAVSAQDYEQWFVAKISQTLSDKKSGKISYHSIDDVAKSLGLYAR
ncbi:MAG: hypothetical protein ACPGRX_01300 [Bdellovibrionales bacterium]